MNHLLILCEHKQATPHLRFYSNTIVIVILCNLIILWIQQITFHFSFLFLICRGRMVQYIPTSTSDFHCQLLIIAHDIVSIMVSNIYFSIQIIKFRISIMVSPPPIIFLFLFTVNCLLFCTWHCFDCHLYNAYIFV